MNVKTGRLRQVMDWRAAVYAGVVAGAVFLLFHNFYTTHPNPENRVQRIQEAIRRHFPKGVPDGLIP